MGEDDDKTLKENFLSKNHGHSLKNCLSQSLLFYFYLIFGIFSILQVWKFLFSPYYSIW